MSHIVNGAPPAASIRLSFPSAAKPMKRESADQNGAIAPSVPDGSRSSSASRDGRLQRERRRVRQVRPRGRRGIERFREPEIEHLHRAVVPDFDVGRLEVAVNDALFVRGLERVCDLLCDRKHLGNRNRSLREAIFERWTLHELHDERSMHTRVLEPVDVRDVG